MGGGGLKHAAESFRFLVLNLSLSFGMDGNMNMSDDQQSLDKLEELKAFDNSKAGVKGLVDAGVVSIPRIFVRPSDELAEELIAKKSHLQVPVIDLEGINIAERHQQIVDEIKVAAKVWGFFQLVNHSIPVQVLDEVIDGIARFNELEAEEKKEFYSRDSTKPVRFNSNYDLFQLKTANWRDTMSISVTDKLNPSELPDACRVEVMEYIKHVTMLGETLFELLSEALGLEPNHLKNLECLNTCRLHCHYYPACPEPERTLGCTKHTDAGFLTILLQNQLNGLQILHADHWIDVNPIPGGLAINVGDLLQLISNDKFRSVEHRVIANRVGPRISIACFFSGPIPEPIPYGPVKELISEENPPLYREVLLSEYVAGFFSRSLQDKLNLDYYRYVLLDAGAHCCICQKLVSGYNFKDSKCDISSLIMPQITPFEYSHPLHQENPITYLSQPPQDADNSETQNAAVPALALHTKLGFLLIQSIEEYVFTC